MKKFLTLILVLVLGVGGIVLSACKKDPGYNLKDLSLDYENIASGLSSFNYNATDKKIVVDYSSFVDTAGKNYFLEALETSPYVNLNKYNFILDNSLTFVNSYVPLCANANNVGKGLRDEIKTNLNNLQIALQKVDLATENFARQVHFSVSGNITDEVYLATFCHLINSYDELYFTAFDLTISLSQVYYNHLLENSNPNVFKIKLEDFEVNDVLVNLESRAKFEAASLSFEYFKSNLANEKISSQISSENLAPDFADYLDYETKVKQVSVPISEESLDLYKQKLESDADLKSSFRDYSIELYNVQTCLNNDFEKYYKATTSNSDFATKIENEYYYLLNKNYEVLAKILSLF